MLQNIPNELRQRAQWVCSGIDKIPLSPRTGQMASVIDPSTWATFDEAVASGYKYIGFVLTDYDDYCIIDLDNKPEKPLTEKEWEVHERILNSFVSYTERSASGRGYHIVTKGRLAQGRRKTNVEVYSNERYMIFTGDVVRDAPIVDCQELLDQLVAEMAPATKLADLEQIDGHLSDKDLVDMAMNASNGDKFTELCNCTSASGDGVHKVDGSYVNLGYSSQSEADFALLAILAFYTIDNEQVRRIFRMSGLGKRDKAKRNDYLDYALSKIRANQPPPVDFSQLSLNAEALIQPKAAPGAPPVPVVEVESVNSIKGVTLPPGLIGELATYFYSTAIRPVPEIALAAAIAITAGVCGRSFNVSGTGLNQYLILLARTGSGKEGAMKGIEKLIAATRPQVPSVTKFMGPAAFSSGQALVKFLDERPCFVSVLGEFGMTLQDISDSRATAPQRMLKKVLLDIYTKSGHDNSLEASVYSDKEKNTNQVRAPNVTILGESTPESFFDTLDASHISEGLIPRFSIIQYEGERPARNRNANQPPPQALIQRFGELVAVALTLNDKNACIPVQTDAEALNLLDAFDIEADKIINSTKQDAQLQLWNRAHLKALKMSALLAVGVNPHQPIITKQLAEWAIDFARQDVEAIAEKFTNGDVGKGSSKQLAELQRIIEQYYKSTPAHRKVYECPDNLFEARIIPKRYLTKRTNNLSAFKDARLDAANILDRTIKIMIESGMLVELDKNVVQKAHKFSGVVFGIGTGWGQK